MPGCPLWKMLVFLALVLGGGGGKAAQRPGGSRRISNQMQALSAAMLPLPALPMQERRWPSALEQVCQNCWQCGPRIVT